MTEPTETGPRRDTPTATAGGEAWPTVDLEEDLRGGRIGAYRILEPLGEGGMGTVFLAEQTEPVRRRVAVKLILTRRVATRDALLRNLGRIAEAEALER